MTALSFEDADGLRGQMYSENVSGLTIDLVNSDKSIPSHARRGE